MLKLRLAFLAIAALGLLAGCHQYSLVDDVQLEFNLFDPPLGPTNELHLPYVQGAKVDIFVDGVDSKSTSGLTYESDDPTILSVDSVGSDGSASCTALHAGTVTLHARLNGSEIVSGDVTVALPTRAVLTPTGPLFVGDPAPLGADNTVQVLNGGTATFLVTYFDGETQLFGNGVLGATPSAGISGTPEQTFLGQEREWIQVTPTATGPQTVALSADGVPFDTLTVGSVDESAVASVSLEPTSTAGAKNGDGEVVLAQAFDAALHPIFGVSYTWNLAGEEQTGEGDLFEYDFDSSKTGQLSAQFGSLSASTSIEAESGTVSSSNDIGCAAAPGAPGGSAAALGLAVAALAVLRLRRRSG
jgi:MYXO-CTERM domain-containing protein